MVGLGPTVDVRSVLWTKSTTEGPTRITRVLHVMRAIVLAVAAVMVVVILGRTGKDEEVKR